MKKSVFNRIITIVALVVVTVGVVFYLLNQQKNETSVTEEGDISGVVINEVMSSNSGFFPDESGDFVDWIELYNPTGKDINLYGYGLSDDETEAIKYSMPEYIIKSGEYLIVFASDKGIADSSMPYAHTNFKLSSKGDMVFLSNSAGQFIDKMDIEPLTANSSYGKNANDPTKLEVFDEPTPGYANDSSGVGEFKQSRIVQSPELIITEVMPSNKTSLIDNNSEYTDWIEIYNTSSQTIDLNDYYVSDDKLEPYKYRLPSVKIKPGAYYLLYASGDITKNSQNLKDGMHISFRLSAYKESLVISNYQGMVLDSLDMSEMSSDTSYERIMTDGVYSDEFQVTLRPSAKYANDEDGKLRFEQENSVLSGDIIISEMMLSNYSYIQEVDGEYYDWIEIYNRGQNKVNLLGYGLTDNTGNPAKWRFPDIELGAGEYLVVQASGLGQSQKTASELKKKYMHTNFSLSLDGDIIALFDASDKVIDRYNVESIKPNTSIGRQNGENILIFPVPTPGLMNTGGVTGYAEMPTIDKEFGVYESAITVNLDVPKNSTCYYTLDGSVPTQSSNEYQGAITIDKTVPFRAAVYKDKFMPSDVLSGTYVIGANHNVDIITINTDPVYLWDDKQGIYTLGSGVDLTDPRLGGTTGFLDLGDGITVFDYNRVSDGIVEDPEDDRTQAMNAVRNANFNIKDFEVPANFGLIVDGKQVFEQNIGLQLFGSYSRSEVQKSFSIYARGKYGESTMDYKFFDSRDQVEFESIVARQSGQDCKFTRIKDIFITSLMETKSDIGVQAYRQCVLYLNGKFWGIYNLREKSNKNFAAERHYAPDPQDNIDFLKGNGLALTGSNEDYKALEQFMDDNDINIQENYEYVKSQMDVYNFMDWLIAEVYFYNTDDGNRKFYRVRSDDGLWRWILFDMDWAMWGDNYKYNYIEEVLRESGTGAGGQFSTSIARGLMENDTWKREFLERYAYLIEEAFAPEVSLPHLAELKTNIQGEVQAECDTFTWVNSFDKNVQRLETFLLERPVYAIDNLQETLGVSDEDMLEIFGEYK